MAAVSSARRSAVGSEDMRALGNAIPHLVARRNRAQSCERDREGGQRGFASDVRDQNERFGLMATSLRFQGFVTGIYGFSHQSPGGSPVTIVGVMAGPPRRNVRAVIS